MHFQRRWKLASIRSELNQPGAWTLRFGILDSAQCVLHPGETPRTFIRYADVSGRQPKSRLHLGGFFLTPSKP